MILDLKFSNIKIIVVNIRLAVNLCMPNSKKMRAPVKSSRTRGVTLRKRSYSM